MRIKTNWVFFRDATNTSAVATPYINVVGDTLTLDINGTNTGINLTVEGNADIQSDTLFELKGINLSTFSTQTDITANGLYQYDIKGCAKVQVKINAVLSGSVTAFGRITDDGR